MTNGRSKRPRLFVRLRFQLEQFALRGLKTRLLIAAALVVTVSLAAGFLVLGLDKGFSDPGEAIWWAFLRLTDPGYLGDDEGVARAAISTIVTVLGYVLFLGLLIAILTQWLNETIQRLESGVTPVALSDHVVVLGWTYQTAAIVETLLKTRGRMKRFLARRGAKELRIVIMVDHVGAEQRQELRDQLGPVFDTRRVLLRSGSALQVEHLERVAFRDAAVVILPGAGFAEKNPERVDAMTIKTLASISRFASESEREPPIAVAELFDARRVDLATQAYAGSSQVIAADGMASRLIAQSVRHRGLWRVMSELFTVNEGNAIYLHPIQGQSGATFHSLRDQFPRAILLGFVRPSAQWPLLNPDPEMVLQADDLPVFLARSFEDCVPGQAASLGPAVPVARDMLRPPPEGPRRVLVLGWSRKVPTLLRELGRYGDAAFEIDVVSRTTVEAREAIMASGGTTGGGAKVNQVVAGFSSPGILEGLDPARYDHVVVLASELLEEREHADAVSVVAAITLRGLFDSAGRRPNVFVELLDDQNVYLFSGGDEDVMVSPTVVSYLVSQVSLRQELASVFWEVTRPTGAQIVLRKADGYLDADGPVTFLDIQRAAAARGEIALGYSQPSDTEVGLALNPDRATQWTVASDDEVVVLTTIEEPEDTAGQA